MRELVDRAKASLEGVTEGPWVSWKSRESRESYSDGYVYRGNVISDSTKQIVVTKSGNAANSLFIAAARQLVPELIAEVERLEKLKTNYFRCGEALTEWRGRAMKAESEAESVKYQLEDECESHRETITERDHWKSFWQGTIEDSTKVIQERDEALREVEKFRRAVDVLKYDNRMGLDCE